MAKPTRTINPLHFEDLEPHRFEDLCRQLIYDYREWSSIEAIGRSGSDEGIDIRAIETIPAINEPSDETDVDDAPPTPSEQRTWIFQCKRERSITPRKITGVVSEFFARTSAPVHGYFLIGACDFSKTARDTFRSEMTARHMQEFQIWGKGELEDMLYLPKNDHLLFAYFGLSLQIVRHSLKTNVNALLTTKRRLVKTLGELRARNFQQVLIRDPRNVDYPYIRNVAEFVKHPQWGYREFEGHEPLNHAAFVAKKYFAYANFATKEWDALQGYNDASLSLFSQFSDIRQKLAHENQKRWKYWEFWNKLPEPNRAWLKVIRVIPYTRIIAVDELGDIYNEPPHLLVEYRVDGDPFEAEVHPWIEGCGMLRNAFRPDMEKRIKFFPETIPDPDPPKEGGPTGEAIGQ